MPIRIDGTDITGATIDGTDVSEITVDGDTVFSAAPPELPITNGLAAQFDFSIQDGSMPVIDSSGNNRDLGTGDYALGSLGGRQAGVFPNQGVRSSGFGTFSKPKSYFVAGFTDTYTDFQRLLGDFGSGGSATVGAQIADDGSTMQFYTDNNLFYNWNQRQTPFIISHIHGSSTMTARLNGVQQGTQSSGGNTQSGFSIGANDGGLRPLGTIGEVLFYDNDQLSNAGQIEQYLSQKWSISI